MALPVPRSSVLLAACLAATFVALAAGARWMLADRFPQAPTDWWRPAVAPPVIDPAMLARAAQGRKARAVELAERRQRVRPIPEALKGGAAVLQTGHAGPLTALAWYGSDLVSAGTDGTLRWWRPTTDGPRQLLAWAAPGIPGAVAADPDHGRVWALVRTSSPSPAPAREDSSANAGSLDALVWMGGDLFGRELTRYLLDAEGVGMALADGGLRAVVLVRRTGAEPGWAVRHYLPEELRLLKEVPLRPAVPPLACALSPDGERAWLALPGPAPGITLEQRRSDDGSLLASIPLVLPWWTAERPGPAGDLLLAAGPDVLVAADSDGWAVETAATAGGPVAAAAAWPFPPGESVAVRRVLACADGRVAVLRGDRWSLARRAAGAWEPPHETADPAGVAACGPTADDFASGTADGSVVVRSASGSLSAPGWVLPEAVVLDAASNALVALRNDPEPAATAARFELPLADFAFRRAAVDGRVERTDPSRGDLLLRRGPAVVLVRDGRETPIDSSSPTAHAVALRAGVSAWLDAGPADLAPGAGLRLELRTPDGTLGGGWRLPAWLADPEPAVSLSRDGRTAVVCGRGGFVVLTAGRPEAALEFEAQGYANAPADLSPADGRVAIGRNDGTIEAWSFESGEVERSFLAFGPRAGAPTVLELTADGETLLAGSSRGAVGAWYWRTGNAMWAGFTHLGPLRTLVPQSGSGWLLTSDGWTATLLDLRTGDPLLSAVLGADGSWAAATPDGYHLAGSPSGSALVALRIARKDPPPGRLPFELRTESDPDLAGLANAVDALRVTLIGAGESPAASPAAASP